MGRKGRRSFDDINTRFPLDKNLFFESWLYNFSSLAAETEAEIISGLFSVVKNVFGRNRDSGLTT